MNKLKLTPEQLAIFQNAVNDSYKTGKQDGSFLASGVASLVTGQAKSLEDITKLYCED